MPAPPSTPQSAAPVDASLFAGQWYQPGGNLSVYADGRVDVSGFLPRVLFATQDDKRAADIGREIARQGIGSITCEAVRQPLIATHIFDQLNNSESLADMEAMCNTDGTRNVEGI